MNEKQLELDNHGERLVPGYSHDAGQIVCHRSTYQLFRKIIEQDILRDPGVLRSPITILDLGCGTGHGTFMLAQLPGVVVEGVDVSGPALAFARAHYDQANITYTQADAEAVLAQGTRPDYVVSRHALEHISNAAAVMQALRFTRRLMLSVPYKEPAENPFHLHNDLDEGFFAALPDPEFIYEGVDGVNDASPRDGVANSFSCIVSAPGLARATTSLTLPLASYAFKGLEKRWLQLEEDAKRAQAERSSLQEKYVALERAHDALLRSRSVRLIRAITSLRAFGAFHTLSGLLRR